MQFFFFMIFPVFFLNPLSDSGQDRDQIVHNYVSAISQVETVSYDMQRIDTFTTGDVWNNRGKCIIRRDASDSLFGFHFLGIRPDISEIDLYDGHQLFSIIDSSKSYTIIARPGGWILGYPGGQMVLPDMIHADKSYNTIRTYSLQDTGVIRLTYRDDLPNNIIDHFKLIYLDPLTHLPIKIISSLISLGRKQVQVYLLNNIKINDPSIKNIEDKNYLRTYAFRTEKKKPSENLVGKKSSGFRLCSFNGKMISLSDYAGKVILLDFWETWCGPCVQSMPAVEALAIKYSKRGLLVLGIMSEVKSLESAKILVKNKGLTFTDLVGNVEVEKMYQVTAVPKFILIDEEGKIIYESSDGYDENLAKALQKKFTF